MRQKVMFQSPYVPSTMSPGRFLFSGRIVLVMTFLLLVSCMAKRHHFCVPSSCGNILNITSPFWLEGDPPQCGHTQFQLSCVSNQTFLNLNDGIYIVRDINYGNRTIRVSDLGVQQDNCSSFPFYTLTYDNFSDGRTHYFDLPKTRMPEVIAFMRCTNTMRHPKSLISASCNGYLNGTSNSNSSVLKRYTYVALGDAKVSDLGDSCSIDVMTLTSAMHDGDVNQNASYMEILKDMVYGVELSWHIQSKGHHRSLFIIVGVTAARLLCGVPLVLIFVFNKWRRRHFSVDNTVEEFLKTHNHLTPIRYSYWDLKKMSKGFKHKLGEGGYGSVYKGQLRGGRPVAIKMLGGKSRANGQEFINEVGTIGRIHHVNVVRLIGFCVQGSKRALVFEFMPNGSLDKHIFSREGTITLSIEKMFEIALGVARGIEYLHRGCDMQILHFDIKPHNILLDENFTPKVSDFGLAKLYPIENSIVSLTAARGTMGYMAPELFYKNIGGISYKADVYSFGMLLMEMASRRKNMSEGADRSSQVYFPSWVYSQFNEGKDIDLGSATEEEKRILKKIIVVALWCIQMKPGDRPSMNKVVELLEGEVECLEMPPTPFQTPKGIPEEDIEHFRNIARWLPGDSSNSLTLVINAK